MTRPADTEDTYNCEALFHVNIQKDVDLQITKRCTFKFAIRNRYIDEVTCEVVPLELCQVILSSPYLCDRDVIHYQRLRKYDL
ncbi:hypothetical protein L3X38_015415 [Prunus dulcis]|uniref:Uncharacterized protein n=1 Tax=Prunus dulcis TaxID=3755 RepID=A0AAD4W3D4_PRUDU|nr:hypothetical protein L3X38_015415 [Prunus dulcis]